MCLGSKWLGLGKPGQELINVVARIHQRFTYQDCGGADRCALWVNWSVDTGRWAHICGLLDDACNNSAISLDSDIRASDGCRRVDSGGISSPEVGAGGERGSFLRNDGDRAVKLDRDGRELIGTGSWADGNKWSWRWAHWCGSDIYGA